jgi:dipeptidyl-peptidase-4
VNILRSILVLALVPPVALLAAPDRTAVLAGARSIDAAASAGTTSTESPSGQLTLHDLFGTERHDGASLPKITWIEGGKAYLTREKVAGREGNWIRTDVRTGKTATWLRAADLALAWAGTATQSTAATSSTAATACTAAPAVTGPARTDSTALDVDGSLNVDGYEVSSDARFVLLETLRRKRWRRSHTAVYYVYDLKNHTLHPLAQPKRSPALHAKFSLDGSQVGFVVANNLYVAPSCGGEARALTTDGAEHVRNGDPDWVYEEEFEMEEAWWWSPDGSSIAYLRFDTSAEQTYPLVRVRDGPYPEREDLPYPKPGTANASVDLLVVDTESGTQLHRVDHVSSADGYIPRVQFTGEGRSLIWQRLDRRQARLELVELANPAPREAAPATFRVTVRADSSVAWIDIAENLKFLHGGRCWVGTSDGDGLRRLYVHCGTLGPPHRSSGSWEVTAIYQVDEKAGAVLIQSTRGGPLTRELDLVPLEGGEPKRICDPGGWHEADVAPDGRYFIETVSSVAQRPRMLLRRIDGSLVRVIEPNSMADLDSIAVGETRFLTVPAGGAATVGDDGVGSAGGSSELNAQIILPPAFDATKRYPALIYCYGGPGSQIVGDRWGGKRYLFHRALATDGIIVFLLDNRGTGGRGREFMQQVYKRLGQLEVEDQLAGAHYLASLPYVDPQRIAIWGWSYGGYLSALTLLRSKGAIAAAASVAPVVDWRFYDTVYTERYMGQPQDNAAGYDAGALLTYAKDLYGKLLLVHGTGDDNVHVQNTLRMAGALQQAGKQFELMMYPDKTHGIEGKDAQEHVYTLLRDFFNRVLAPAGAQAAGTEGKP